jgi:hypothetical protein
MSQLSVQPLHVYKISYPMHLGAPYARLAHFKKENRLQIIYLAVPPLTYFEQIGRFHELLQGGHAIEGDLDAIF